MRSRHDIKTLIFEQIGRCVDGLPAWMRMTLISHAEQADRDGDDVRVAIEECSQSIGVSRLDQAEKLQGPHGVNEP